jgi:hypothetical protein
VTKAEKDPAAKAQGSPKSLPDEAVEHAKRTILYGVGYGRPPERTRFKKGQSGNPKGRPKADDPGTIGPRSADALVMKEAERLITVREGEETRQITAIEAVLRSQYVSATKGNAHSQKHIVERYDRAESGRRRQIQEENEFWERYVATQREAIAEAKRKGEEPPAPLPHPDDVVIDDKGVRFIGPIDDEMAAELAKKLKLRDLFFMQDVLERRQALDPHGDDRRGTAFLWAGVLNNGVPIRFRLSDDAIEMQTLPYKGMRKRELLKTVYSAWREIGIRLPRGRSFPSRHWGEQILGLVYEMASEALANNGRISDYTEQLSALLTMRPGRNSSV